MIDQAGKEPSASGSAAQVVSEHELHELPKKEKEDGELEKLEVRCDPHLSRRDTILTPS